jgi:hypothetical protein
VNDDAVVGPDRVGLHVVLLPDPRREGQAPGGVNATAPGREDAQPPVADLVAEALDDDRLVGGDHPRRRLLLAQVRHQVLRRPPLQVVLLGELCGLRANGLAGEGADRLAQVGGPADPVALPERHRARHTRRRGHHHAVSGDLSDPPGRGAEQERLPRARLVDHLLVQLADAPSVGKVDAV